MNISWLTTTNKLYYIVAGMMAIVVLITVVLIFQNLGGRNNGETYKATIEVWGVFDELPAYSDIIGQFKQQYRGANVVYKSFSYEEYERTLVNEMAAGKGPDVFMIHHTWLPKHADKVVPMPEKFSATGKPLMTLVDYNNQFVEIAAKDLVFGGKIYGIPLYVDTLALYYNRDHFNAAAVPNPPKTWEEFNILVEKMTRLDAGGNITKPGAAIGTAANINRSTDILMSLMIQTGARMTSDDHGQASFDVPVSGIEPGKLALQYYTDFANPRKRVYTWSPSQNYSVDSFVQGDVSMMFNYSHQAKIIRDKNPRLNFAIAPMPQVNPQDAKTYGNYWALVVSSQADDKELAWAFNTVAGSKSGTLSYLSHTLRPSARRDLIDLQKDDANLGVFAVQSLTAKSWFQPDNMAVEKIFIDMIEDINFGRADYGTALDSAASKVNVLLKDKKIK